MKIFNKIQKRTVKIWLLLFILTTSISFITVSGVPKQQDEILISGTVTDATTDEPLPGVSIMVKGTSVGIVTDLNGKYSIHVPPGASLQFSYIGYLTEEYTVTDETELSVKLVPDIIGLEEVVVVGYGIQKKSDVTGSIASVSSEKLTEVPVAGIDQALQGRAAGVNIIPKSGRPGEGSVIQIRGITSVNDISPLIVIDGSVYRDVNMADPNAKTYSTILSDLNPNDIESIEVLKDASSAAIYGASGGNGVIIITTKKGETGKLKTSFNYYAGIEKTVGKIDMMNSQQWLQTAEEVSRDETAITSRPDTFPTYDWQDYAFEPAYSQNYDLSIRGGSEKSTYRISSSYNKQNGIIRNSDYTRFTVRINSDHELTKRLTVEEKIYFINTKNLGFYDDQWHQYYDGPIRPCIEMVPAVPDYLPDGDWANGEDYGLEVTVSNPLAKLDMIDRTETYNLLEGNISAKVDIFKGLSFTSRLVGRIATTDVKEYQDDYFNTALDRRLPNEVKLLSEYYKGMVYNAQQLLTYSFSLANAHNISLMSGMEASQEWGFDLQGERNSMPSDLPELLYFTLSEDNTGANQIIDGGGYKRRRLAYFGRLNYDYKGKYMLTANIRRDGDSDFGPAYRFGVFPSISLGWKFSEEAFMQNQSLISFGKLRYGYGESGAFSKSGAPYESLIQNPDHFGYAFDNTTSLIGAAPVQLPNSEIHWETIVTSNLGLDLYMIQNRISITAEYYTKVNDGMLMLRDVAYEGGTYSMGAEFDGDETNPEVNIGSIKNSGFEFSIGYRKMKGDLKGSFDLNFSTLKNEILDLATDSMAVVEASVHNISDITFNRIGHPVSQFWGWEIDGIYTLDDCERDENGEFIRDSRGRFSILYHIDSDGDTVFAQSNAQPGDAKFVDVNGNGEVLEKEDKVILGSPLPKLIYGFSVNLEYKGLDFSAFFNGTIGNKIFNGTKQYTYYSMGNPNHAAAFADRYVVEDIVKYDPVTGEEVVVVPENHNTKLWRNASTNYAKPTSFYIEDGSYLRLRNITLGYTIPGSLTQKIGVNKFRIYAGAKNLFTITKYTGINPEVGDRGLLDMGIDIGVYPATTMYLFGVNLVF
jgi:TonB-linked SusC/RagA family outer membrane protein